MPLHVLPAAEGSEPVTVGSFLNTLIYDFLPAFAVWAGLMAAIWIACAIITLAGAFIGVVVVTAIQDVAQSRDGYFRCPCEVVDDPLVIADTDEGLATITELDHDRQPDDLHQSEDADPDDRFRGDDPA